MRGDGCAWPPASQVWAAHVLVRAARAVHRPRRVHSALLRDADAKLAENERSEQHSVAIRSPHGEVTFLSENWYLALDPHFANTIQTNALPVYLDGIRCFGLLTILKPFHGQIDQPVDQLGI